MPSGRTANGTSGHKESRCDTIQAAVDPPNAKKPKVSQGEDPDTQGKLAKEKEAASIYESSWRKSSLETLPEYDTTSQRHEDPPEYTRSEAKRKGIREKLMSAVKTRESEYARRQRKKEYKDLGLDAKVVFGMDGGPQSSV